MENMNTKERYRFACGRWLSKKDDDKQIIRELPAEGPHIKKPLPVVKYFVDVHTGKRAGAGTNANVFLNIFGDCGDTGGNSFATALLVSPTVSFVSLYRTSTRALQE